MVLQKQQIPSKRFSALSPLAVALLSAVGALAAPASALAQDTNAANNAQNTAAAAAAFAGCGLVFLFIILVAIAINVIILVWVARDAKARKMDNVALWVVLVIFTGLIGLIVYIIARPKGDLVECPNCHKKRLAGSPGCPHCGAA